MKINCKQIISLVSGIHHMGPRGQIMVLKCYLCTECLKPLAIKAVDPKFVKNTIHKFE